MTIKVFAMNDCDWVAAVSLESAKRFYMESDFSGDLPENEAMDSPHEVSDADMDLLVFTDDNGSRSSFRHRLVCLEAERVKFPCLFASTEY